MKLNEYQLLDAIGHADEKLVRDTAPQQWETETRRRPLLHRRASELIAVCAALVIFVGAGFLIRNLYTAQKPFRSEQSNAREALERFLDACEKGDVEEMLGNSLIAVVSGVIYEDREDAMQNIEDYVNGLSKLTDYQIGTCTDCTDKLNEARQTEYDLTELSAYILKSKGRKDEAEQLFRENAALDYYNRTDMMFAFQVKLTGPDEENSNSDGRSMAVVHYDGKWYAQPIDYLVPEMSDDARDYLEEFRNSDPETWDLGDDNSDAEAEKAATETITQFLKICQQGDKEKIRSCSLLEQVCAVSGSEDPADIEKEVSDYVDAYARVDKYLIFGSYNTTSELDQERQCENDRVELNSYYADYFDSVGKTERAAELRKPSRMQEFLRHADMQYAFLVQVSGTDPHGEICNETESIYAVRYDGTWYAQPVWLNAALRMNDEETDTLERLRQGEALPAIIEDHQAKKQQEQEQNQEPAGIKQTDAVAALQSFLQICETGDVDAIRSQLYADQVFKLENPDLTDEEREQKIRDYILAHYAGFPADAEIGTVEDIFNNNLYLKQFDIHAYIDYLAYQSGNAIANRATMMDPEKNAHLYLDMVENAYSMYAYTKERSTAESHFILVYVQNRWRILPFVYQEQIPKDVLEAAREYEYGIYAQ